MLRISSPYRALIASGAVLAVLVALFTSPADAEAHVKWFSDFSFSDEPATLSEVITPTFIGLALLSVFTIGAMVLLDRRMVAIRPYARLNDWLASFRGNSLLILRIGTGLVLMLSWQADALLMPELEIPQAWVGWLQFVVALLLLLPRTTPLAGVGLLALYVIGLFEFGSFYMLDYILYVGVAWYLMVSRFEDPRINGTGLPALYFTLGFSLCWVALEKLIYPQWGLYILENNPQLALGFDIEFFLVAAAFVEFALGYLLIINLLQRPLALVITLVFFGTTLVFGKVEIIGHLLIHAALVVFIIEGPGETYRAPITFHKRLPMRLAFATVNFVLLLVILIVPYSLAAEAVHEDATTAAVIEETVATGDDPGDIAD